MAETQARIRFVDGGFDTSIPVSVQTGVEQALSSTVYPCKEWSIADDILNMCDTACVTVPNVDGENSDQFYPGQRVEIELANQNVRDGRWLRQFTGIVTETQTGSDMSGGSVISITAMDVGWYLTSCCARPFTNIKGIFFKALLEKLIDPSWGIGEVVASNDLNRRLKHGRQVIQQNQNLIVGQILKFIQVEPGQKPFDIIQTYAQREGVLVNASVDGKLVFFRPDYDQQALFRVSYRPASDPGSVSNNVIGKPSLRQTIDGLYSKVTCFSTIVLDPGLQDTENPNAAFRSTAFPDDYQKAKQPKPKFTSPIGFQRLEVLNDPEAINDKLRWNRAKWKWQLGLFNSWQYDVEFDRHEQDGAMFASDTMITCDDTVNNVKGTRYVQSVRKSHTLKNGSRTSVTIRRPGLLDPTLQTLDYSKAGGAAGAAKVKARPRAKLPADLAKLVK